MVAVAPEWGSKPPPSVRETPNAAPSGIPGPGPRVRPRSLSVPTPSRTRDLGVLPHAPKGDRSMSFELIPGNALGCRTNAHRHGWNGTICEGAASWSCGIDQEFREKYCENRIPRCFHLHIFDDADPYLVIPDSGVGWVLNEDPHAFDQQILLVWAPESAEPGGALGGKPSTSFMAGAYRVESVERIEHRNHIEWEIRPYRDGWVYLGPLQVQAPRFIHLDGPYIKQVERAAVDRLFQQAEREEKAGNPEWTPKDTERLERFFANLDEWFAAASARTPEPSVRLIPQPNRRPNGGPQAEPAPAARGPEATGVITPQPKPPAVEPAPMKEPTTFTPLIEEAKQAEVGEVYGEATLKALLVGSLTKPILLLRGEPGVGKSRLAVELLDDLERERTLVVPVGSEWRSSEDLFGHFNPTKNLFEATDFTHFLHRAELAWNAGDRRTRIVVLEDFDLAHPEGWFSEILSRCQYPGESRRDRTIELEGHAVRGWERGGEASLFLAPSVRFVGTIDVEGTRRSLSLRVLDRSAVIPISMDPRTALERTSIKLTPKQLESVVELDQITRPLHASFSLHAAHSLKACLGRLDDLGTDAWGALDLVLRQEVLAKLAVRESAPPAEAIEAWAARFGAKLRQCALAVAEIREQNVTAEAQVSS